MGLTPLSLKAPVCPPPGVCKFIVKHGLGVLKTRRKGGILITITQKGRDFMWYERLQRFLYGRYGTDTLNLALLVLGLVLTLLGGLFFWPLSLLAYVLYIYALFRTFSRNIPARQRERAPGGRSSKGRGSPSAKLTNILSAPPAVSSCGLPGAGARLRSPAKSAITYSARRPEIGRNTHEF